MNRFAISNNYLLIENSDQFEKAKAQESFDFIKSQPSLGIRLNVNFGSYQVFLFESNDDMKIHIGFKLIHNGNIFDLEDFSSERDYYVDNENWFPIDPGEIEELKELFLECSINSFNDLTVSQALYVSVQSARLGCSFENKWNLHNLTPIMDEGNTDLVRVTPFPYQVSGFNWLSSLRNVSVGGILGDEMGLGKTLQAIMLIESEVRLKRIPNLIVCPPSLTENWKREIAKFVGRMSYTHKGSDRIFDLGSLKNTAIVIVSYDTLRRDRQLFAQVNWNVVAADEAQYIKNASSERSVSVKMLPKKMGLAITGTPIETSLSDIWSISDFTIPGVLGSQKWFKRTFEDDIEDASRIRTLIKPLILRRKVMEVAADLPEIIKRDVPINFSSVLLDDYISIKKQEILGMGDALRIAGELRQACCHIQIVKGRKEIVDISGKFEYLHDSLLQIFATGLKAIIFSPYTITTEYLARWLKDSFGGIFVEVIYGATKDKQDVVDDFTNSPLPGVLVINPRAGGVGLNITAANHVFHFAPDWNPAILDQANARAFRRGQDRPVTIHNLFYSGSIEEEMMERINLRRILSETALEGTDLGPTLDELRRAIEKDPEI